MVDLLMQLVEMALYVLITFWVLGLALTLLRKPFSAGGGKAMGVGGHLVIAGVVGTMRLLGRAVRAVVGGFFRHVAPGIAQGFAKLTQRIAARATRRHYDDHPPRQRRRRRLRLPRISFEWPSQPRRELRRSGTGTYEYPADEFSDEWRRAAGDDL